MNTAVRWLERARDWLDERGKAGVDRATVIGFVLFWPIGLALLFYIIWSKRMSCNWRSHHHHRPRCGRTGNTAFDWLPRGDAEAAGGGARLLPALPRATARGQGPAEFDQFMSSRQAPQPA